MSKGLKTCATIWTAVLGIGSFVAACILWSNADGGYYYRTNGTFVALGFLVLFGGLLIAVTGYFFLNCIAEIAENNSVYVTNYSEEKIKKMLEETLAKTMSGVKASPAEEQDIADNLPEI